MAAACAEGETVLSGAEELRVKESDRIRSTCAALRALGAEVTEHEAALAQDAFTYQLDTLSAWASMLVFYNHVRGGIETDLLVIFFDEEDRVREVSFPHR